MTVAATIAADHQFIDGIESVTFTDLDGNATSAVAGLRGGLNYREQQLMAAGSYQGAEMTWELWSATMSSNEPVAGCIVTDSNAVAYSVLAASQVTIGQTSIKWRCICRKRV